jgi:hypothetical protein
MSDTDPDWEDEPDEDLAYTICDACGGPWTMPDHASVWWVQPDPRERPILVCSRLAGVGA